MRAFDNGIANMNGVKTRVELAKVTAEKTPAALGALDTPSLAHDNSTNTLIRRYQRPREARP